jgi:predicted nucleic acid-binding protein
MIVVADTSPINYLILINEIDILQKMYGTVVIPPAVLEELQNLSTPVRVRTWLGNLPSWFQIRAPFLPADASLANLDPGAREAITLASELHADQLIVDEREGRNAALQRGIPVIGTLGVLREAATLGLLNIHKAVQLLKATSFYVSPEVLANLLKDFP